MALTLTMLRCPDNVAPETRTVSGGEYSIGRGPENDWVLADPELGLSKRHCVVAFRAGSWQVADFSTNGTFVNRETKPVGRGQARELRNGDRLSFGAYEIEVRVDAAALASRAGAASDPYAQRRSAAPEMFALDPFAKPPSASAAGDSLLGEHAGADPFVARLGPGPVSLPADFDPLAPDPEEREFRGPTQADHTPHIEDAFAPARVRSVLPEDWDREVGAQPPAALPRPVPVAEPVPTHPEPVAAEPPAVPARAPPPLTPPRAADELLAAFLRGAGLADIQLGDPGAVMETLGAASRAVVTGLRQAMIARAAVKSEFRIEQTMIRSRGNNPLKFSANDDDALAALLGAGRRSEMGAVEAVSDALRDIRLHELATISAMQTAVSSLLAELEPARLRQAAERGGLSLMAAQRKAHAWDAFEQLHAKISQALMDDFDSVFGKAFARAYERALAEIAAREPES
jgi:type VI secretion system FHA domain protein